MIRKMWADWNTLDRTQCWVTLYIVIVPTIIPIHPPTLFTFIYIKLFLIIKECYVIQQDQYKFVYDTLEEFVVCGTSWFPVKELSQRLKQKSMKNVITKINEYQREYQVQYCSYQFWRVMAASLVLLTKKYSFSKYIY
jgi:hypothetical protein